MRLFTGKRPALRLNLSSLLTIFIFAAGVFVLALPFGVFNTQASGTISGIVFQDFNGNGTFEASATIANSSGTGTVGTAIDSGVAGVEVRAYDSSGNNATTGGFVTTGANGNYSLIATGTGPYRIEFTNIPAGYNPSARSTDSVQGGTATNSGTTVQFVLDGSTGNVNLALDRPEEYCQNNPNLVTSKMIGGSQSGANAAQNTVLSFPYSAGTSYTDGTVANYDSPSAHTTALTANQTGTVFGLAFARKADRIYAASFFKKYAGFGPGANGTFNEGGASSDDPGAIYVINPATSAVASTFTVPNTGTNSHNVSDYNADNGDTAVNAVGKTSLGGIALSDDESALYVMNLQNRTLYSLNPATGATIASQAVPTSAVPTPGGSAANCAAADVRPFAVRYYRGQVYISMVCSAESTGNVANLFAYVYSADPSTLAFSASPVFQAPLNYARGEANPGAAAEWQAWRATATGNFSAPQPMLTDMEFDRGNLILGFKDRAGDQAFDNGTNAKRTAGDTLRACGSVGAWTLESNGRCGGTGNATQGNGQGPGNGEFYYEDEYSIGGNTANFHDEVTWGGLTQIPGDPNVVVNVLDPIDRDVSDQTFDGGFRWFNNTTGASNKAYRIYNGTGAAGQPDFGKVNGLGDIVALCDPAPIEIGNRVWLDSNANGVQDAGENGISGVTAHLFNSANTQIGAAVTDTNGEYYFVSSTAADGNTTDNIGQINGGISTGANYQVRFDLAANYNAGGPLNGRFLTAVNSGFQNGDVDGSDSDAGNVANPTGSPAGTFPVISLTTGSAGDNDHTFDVGFSAASTYSIGNRVWYDTDNDGRVDAGEAGINGVSVSLFADSNSDGAPDTPGTPVGTVTTAGGGYYRFDSLAAGSYVVRINSTNFDNSGDVLYSYQNTSGNVTADTDSTATSSGENGINPAGAANSVQANGILSNTITLGAGVSEPVGESDLSASGQGSPDGFADMTVDFGFYRLCVGNLVFNDMGAGVNRDNGNFDSGEIGRAGVRVRLYNGAGTEIPVGPDGILGTADDAANGLLTDSGGNYQFCGMPQGTYRGAVFPGGPNSSTPTDTTPDDNKDSDDNGAPTGVAIGSIPASTIVSTPVTLTPGSAGALSANTVTNSTGSTTNPTLDFGLVVSPTAVKMAEFRADETKDGIGLSWQSSFEANNLGYRVWRDGAGGRELVGKDLIAGSALQVGGAAMTAGSEYRVLDGAIKNSNSQGASYWLEAVDLDGSSEWFGPVTVEGRYSSDNFTQFAPAFSDLNANNSLLQTEYIERVPENSSSEGKAANQFAADSGALKIKVNRTGWCHIDAADLATNGFDVSRSPAWHLSTGGNEEAILVGDDGSVEFYGRGLDAPYSDTRVYWLSVGQPGARRIKSSKLEFDPNAQAGLSDLTVERQDRPVRASSILNGDRENWYAAIVNTTESVSNLTLINLAADSGRMAKLSVNLQGLNAGEHRVAVTLNGSEIGQASIDSMGRSEWQMDISAAQLHEGQNQIGVRSLNGSADVSLLETVSITYPRNLKAVDNRVEFRNEPGRSVKLTGFTTDQARVFDVTDPAKATMFLALPNAEADGTFSISVPAMPSARSLLAQGNDRMLAPVSIERNGSSSLRSSNNRADFVIIAPAQFHGQLAALQAKRESEGLCTMLVDVEDIFDEFSFGMRNPQAVKDFLQYAKASWATKPGYVLLVGDASADPRNYSGLGGPQVDLVPTMWFDTQSMTASSDELLADQNGDGIGEMSIGRLPVRTPDDLSAVLAKILSFDPLKSSAANERGALTVADSSIGYDFAGGNQNLRGALPADMSVAAINRADGDTAQVRQQLIDRMNAGPLMVNFFGHGSTGIWTSGGIFRLDDASALTNEQRPSLVTMLTCLNGAFAEQNETMSEVFLKARHGGAFAAFSFSSMNYPDVQEAMAGAWYRSLVGGSRLGDAARSAKTSYDHLDTRYTLTLFGDPTQRVFKMREK
jgi:hypothetical protein